ncbi:MAG: TspO/MBR family protein [Burkholderiales bacterium]|jgi:benzodiazapine receptor
MQSSNFTHSIRTQALGLVGWLIITFAAAALGAIASVDAAVFYAELIKPSWAPPASVFGPVWSILYLLMGVSVWLVWREPQATKQALGLFVAQLSINALWSWLYFVWHLGAWSFVGVLLLLLLIVATLFSFWKIRRMAVVLMIPYLLWVGFAAVLTWTTWQSNPMFL